MRSPGRFAAMLALFAGAGQVATIVVTSHGPRGVRDSQPANHYSTLATIEDAFGLGCIGFACDTANVQPLSPLVQVTGSAALATTVQPQLTWPTPTPSQPSEPLSYTTATPKAAGWTVQKAQLLGGNDNSLGAIAGSSPTDVWAVGNYLPDAANINQDATLTFAEHYDGKKWSVVRTPNEGPNFNSFYGLAAAGGEAWAVGENLNSSYQDRALVEVWSDGAWHVPSIPQPGSVRDMLFGATAAAANDVWVVGDQEGCDQRFETLAEHWDGSRWSVVPTPDPGSNNEVLLLKGDSAGSWSIVGAPNPGGAGGSDIPGGIANVDGQLWMAGAYTTATSSRLPLIEQSG